jgi:filamentous hemagglutinin family protein
VTYAQVTPPITSSGLNTQVSAPINLPSGGVQYNITGGTRPGNGLNLFHSFGEFGVPTNNIANLLNEAALPTSNILSRVTGGNPSNIFGTIKTTDFGNANLFLINPAGVVFGPNASLDIGSSVGTPGSFHVSTADYLKMTDGSLFIANPNFENSVNSDGSVNTTVLSSAAPQAFGFLSSSPTAITFDNSFLAVGAGQTLSGVGGDITITGGALNAPAGQINLASVASPGEILLSPFQRAPLPGQADLPTMGSMTLSQGSTLDVSADAAGTVRIRSGQFEIADSTIKADTGNNPGAPVAIDINVTDAVSLSHENLPVLTASPSGAGNAGDILISSGSLNASFSATEVTQSLIDSHTMGSGHGGNVTITTGPLTMDGNPFAPGYFIDSGTGGEGNGGNVSITAGDAQIKIGDINTGDAILFGVGSGGNLILKADTLKLETVSFATDSLNARGGDLTLDARDITVTGNSFLGVLSLEGGSTVTIKADRFAMDGSSKVLNQTALGPGGGVTITGKVVEFTNGSGILSETFGDGDAGSIRVTATDHVTLSDDPGESFPSGLFTSSFGELGTLGNAGAIEITTPRLTITGGARINSTTRSSGRGGDVTVAATDGLSISGELAADVPSEFFGLGSTRASGIYTRTVGSEFCTGLCGNAGAIDLNIGSLFMGAGSRLDSGTSSTGLGGKITIHATDAISLSGTLSDGTPVGIFSRTIGTDPGSGSGGTIELQARQVDLSNGAAISAQSTGTGPAGNILIGKDAPVDALVMQQSSSITTESAESGGGSIEIHAGSLVQLTDSSITTSVHGGGGDAGNITIDPEFVILENSQILAQAFGGNGGNILIVAGVFFADPNSTVSASSTQGVSGTVDIQAPVTNLSGTLAPLPAEIVQAAALLQARCAARLAGGTSSSFVVAGRDGLPLEPGGMLSSPLYVESERSTRLAESLGLSALRVGRPFVESHLTLTPLVIGCSS